MMVRPLREAMAAVTGALSLGFTTRMWCDMVVTAPWAASTSWRAGSFRYRSTRVLISFSMVAENSIR